MLKPYAKAGYMEKEGANRKVGGFFLTLLFPFLPPVLCWMESS